MVDALASDRSDQPFGEAVLPRRAWSDGLVADAHGAQSVRDGSAIDAIPITDQVARRLSPRECFGDLACDPVRGRMGCDVDPDKLSAGQPNDDKGIEQVEANGRNNEQVHGGDVRRVVTQEGAPALGRRATSERVAGQLYARFATSGGLDAVYGRRTTRPLQPSVRRKQPASQSVASRSNSLWSAAIASRRALTRSRPTRCRPPSRKSRPTSVSGQPMRSTRTSKARSCQRKTFCRSRR